MASKNLSSVSNTSALSQLMARIPDAAQLTERALSTEAAQTRRTSQAERAAAKAAKEKHTIQLAQSLVQHLTALFVQQFKEAADKGWGYVSIFECRPPQKEEGVDPETGEKCLVFIHPAEETHWAGLGEDGAPRDPSEEGVPLVMLLQGPKPRDSKLPDPKLMPGGKTVPMLMMEEFAKAKKNFGVQCTFSKGKLRVWVIWDRKAWREWTEARAPRRPAAAAEPVPEKPQMSLDEYRASKSKAPTPKAQADDDGFTEVKRAPRQARPRAE